jgi:hypothetical protein
MYPMAPDRLCAEVCAAIVDTNEEFDDLSRPRSGRNTTESEKMFQQRLRGYGRSRLELPSFVVDQILASDYAKLVARKKSVRRALLPQIVSLHTKRDLGAINGLGPASIRRIEIWLAQLDTRLRNPNESIDTVICRFRPWSLSRFGEQAPLVATSREKWRRGGHAESVDAGITVEARF